MNIELKPCPFCGRTDIHIEPNGIGDYSVVCGHELTGCGASTSDYRCESEEQAVERWNRRMVERELEALRQQHREIQLEAAQLCGYAKSGVTLRPDGNIEGWSEKLFEHAARVSRLVGGISSHDEPLK